MKRSVLLVLGAWALTLVTAPSASAGALEDGLAAHKRGDDAEAIRLWTPLALAGNYKLQYELGLINAHGHVPQNYAEAMKWYRMSLASGFTPAADNLGAMYTHGEGVSKNDVEAARLFKIAADQGLADAQYNLGVLYASGAGVPRDTAEAVRLFRLAADQNYLLAEQNLGAFYMLGQGVTKDTAEATRWFRKAADQGNPVAQYNLGFLYGNGDGVPRDYPEAYKWLTLAADGAPAPGIPPGLLSEAARLRDVIGGRMTSDQIAQARAAAQAWRGQHR